MGLNSGATAGVVISILFVLALGLYYIKHHADWARRFINLDRYGFVFVNDVKTENERSSDEYNTNDSHDNSRNQSTWNSNDYEVVDFRITDPVENPLVVNNDIESFSQHAVGIHSTNKSLNGSSVHKLSDAYSGRLSGKSQVDDGEDGEDHHEELQVEQVSVTSIVKAGYLYKKATNLKKSWLSRWFFIIDGKLFYTYKQSDLVGKKHITAVPVANLMISTIKIINPKEFQIISPGQRGSSKGGGIYELLGDNEDDVSDWIRIILQQIEGSLTKTLASNEDEDASKMTTSTFFVPNTQTINELKSKNPMCADCGNSQPIWASLNLCIMICIECSGIHRSLGSHISKVRSITLDKWSHNSIQLLLQIGNKNANDIWEASLTKHNDDIHINPQSSMEARDVFIHNKYVSKSYLKEGITSRGMYKQMFQSCTTGDLISLMESLCSGIDINKLYKQRTALMYACEYNQVLCVELLCQWNASIDILLPIHNNNDSSNSVSLTAYHIAKEKGYQDIMDILIANGCQV
eukprot:gene8997-12137_t